VVINIGTNDNNQVNNVSSTDYYNDYVALVGNIHKIWPKANIVLMVRNSQQSRYGTMLMMAVAVGWFRGFGGYIRAGPYMGG
jgi:accessory colonization factor AcfC